MKLTLSEKLSAIAVCTFLIGCMVAGFYGHIMYPELYMNATPMPYVYTPII